MNYDHWKSHDDSNEDFHDIYERCPRHPAFIISNGMFDAPCGACEGEMDDARHEAEVEAEPNSEPNPRTAWTREPEPVDLSSEEIPF